MIEDKKLGLAKEIHQDKMREYFKKFLRSQNFKTKVPVDVVCLAVPDSDQIAEEFSKLGVPHVVAFEQLEEHRSTTIEQVLTPYRYNYIYCFCLKFYSLLVCQNPKRTVREAFMEACLHVEDP